MSLTKQASKVIRQLAPFAQESERTLKRRWQQVPARERAEALQQLRLDLAKLIADRVPQVRTIR